MFCPDFCTVLPGYPLAILHEKCFNFQCKIEKIPMFSRGVGDVLLGYPLAILHPRFAAFGRASTVSPWFLQGLVGYPLSVVHEKCFNFQCKIKKLPMFSRAFCDVLLGYPLAILHQKRFTFPFKIEEIHMFTPGFCSALRGYPLAISSENHAICNATSRKFQRFARLPPGNFA